MKIRNTFLLLIMFCSVQQLIAHPHMMLTNRCTLHVENDQIQGVTLEWEFDKFFSADISFSFDTDKNGLYNREETAEVYQYAFSNLAKYNYFAFFREQDRRFTPEGVENFQVWNLDDETAAYSFYIPLDDYTGNELNIAVYDYSFFCNVSYDEENPLTLDMTNSTITPEVRLVENRDYPVYYDPFAPATDLSVHDEWRPGLETFYPTEIQIEF